MCTAVNERASERTATDTTRGNHRISPQDHRRVIERACPLGNSSLNDGYIIVADCSITVWRTKDRERGREKEAENNRRTSVSVQIYRVHLPRMYPPSSSYLNPKADARVSDACHSFASVTASFLDTSTSDEKIGDKSISERSSNERTRRRPCSFLKW